MSVPKVPTKMVDEILHKLCKNKDCGFSPVSEFTITYQTRRDGKIANYYASYCKKCVCEAGRKYRQKRSNPVLFREEYMKKISWWWPKSLKRAVSSGKKGELHPKNVLERNDG